MNTIITETAECTVKRGRGRPRKHPVNNMRFVRTVAFACGVAAFNAEVPADETDNKLNLLGRRFAKWHLDAFNTQCPQVPGKGQWLRNYKPFMEAFSVADKAGVFDMNALDTAAAEHAADQEEVDETENHMDLSQLEPAVESKPVPLRGPTGRFLTKTERAALEDAA